MFQLYNTQLDSHGCERTIWTTIRSVSLSFEEDNMDCRLYEAYRLYEDSR